MSDFKTTWRNECGQVKRVSDTVDDEEKAWKDGAR